MVLLFMLITVVEDGVTSCLFLILLLALVGGHLAAC